MIRSFLNLYRADLGADTANVAAMLLRLPAARYPTQQSHVAFYDRLKTHLESSPGVKVAALGAIPAGGMSRGVAYELAGAAAVDAEHRPTVGLYVIGPDYFQTVDAHVLTGREFTLADGPSGLAAVVVNQQFATEHWPGATAIGRTLRVYSGDMPDAWLTVVGVVSNVMQDSRRQAVTPMLYVPFAQVRRAGEDPWLLIRTASPDAGVLAMLRREVHAVDPDVIIWLGPSPVRDRLMLGIYGSTRNQTALLSIFAVIALLLASVGIYAVLAHAVSRRTQEMGVRAALGATAGDIVTLVFKQGMRPVMIGLLIGTAGALLVAPILQSQLIGISAADPLALVAASAALTIAAAIGCVLPAHRATRVDPMVALRFE
jgi:putative ABC transport system permease protein